MQFWVNPYCLKMLSHPDSTIYTFKMNDWMDPPPDDKYYSERIITSITINGKTICGEEPITTTTLTATSETFTT